MRAMQKIKVALALAAVLAMSSTGWAKSGGPGIPGDLNGSRNSVDLSVPVPAYDLCDTTNTNHSYSVTAYILQPSGRMFAMGISDPASFTCSLTTEQLINVTINAFPGLTFKPGPATLLFKVILTDNTTTPPVDTNIYEFGSRVDLH